MILASSVVRERMHGRLYDGQRVAAAGPRAVAHQAGPSKDSR